MHAVSPAIRPALIPPLRTDHFDHARLSFASVTNRKLIARAAAATIDYGDPDWKTKYRDEFEARFRIPHFTDVLDDAVSYPSTFCLRMRFVVRVRVCVCDFGISLVSSKIWSCLSYCIVHGYM